MEWFVKEIVDGGGQKIFDDFVEKEGAEIAI